MFSLFSFTGPTKLVFFIKKGEMDKRSFQVSRVINNNVVICISEDEREMVAMGKGIGYDFKTKGDIDESHIEKIFSIEEPKSHLNIKSVFSSIPENLINLCIEIVDKAKEDLSIKLSDNIYITLSDHIHYAIIKAAEGIDTCSALTGEVKVFYPGEYLVGKEALAIIKEKLGVSLPEDEACAIALHIVNAEYNTHIGSIVKITQAISEIISIISAQIDLDIRDDDVAGASFISFLKYFVFRSFTATGMDDLKTDRMYTFIREIQPNIIMLTDKIDRYLTAISHKHLSKMDKAVLATNIYFFCEYIKRSHA